MAIFRQLWRKHRVNQLRREAVILRRCGKLQMAVETNALAAWIEEGKKRADFQYKRQTQNPFLDDDGNLLSGLIPRKTGKVILEGDHPARCKEKITGVKIS